MTDLVQSDVATSDGGVDRFERVDKFQRRRGELADATLATLGELGYARTSLREIAQKTEFSHGVLHYYFKDKIELITFGVRRYKEHCVTRYDEAVATATDAPQLAAGFADALVDTLVVDTAMHRLWYDLRTQSAFEEALRPTVIDLDHQLQDMIWRVVVAYAKLRAATVAVDEFAAYTMFDGLFENCLIRYVSGDGSVVETLRGQAVWLLDAVCRD
ncbi:TetR family transcriptional regulator [Gordonia sp. TBRC 11910]|uniref:TetR family transcriptional regulator n=1 Tax=Gordonia asplenii TaxID=2725283 RepID=A0A848L204_9ACTN|nr:TetR/AcrR family transcriptional regulator [Gordonia asplenii]NMO02551.1 TetR family transcriptional regulator [Gordonia asplenii]